MNKVSVRKLRPQYVRIRLDPPLQLALRGLRKEYFRHARLAERTDKIIIAWALNHALIHWPTLAPKVWDDRKYNWLEGIHNSPAHQMRRVQMVWNTIRRLTKE